jgi:hypothetical protein
MNIEVCDIVEYGLDSFGRKPQTWRVTHHLKMQTYTQFRKEQNKDKNVSSRFFRKWAKERIKEARATRKKEGKPYRCRYRLLYCRPEEATHVELVSVCGSIAPIKDCKKIGVVPWEENKIKEEKQNAVSDFWLSNDFWIDWEWK